MPDGLEKFSRLFMTTDTVGGVWQYSIDLAAGLQAEGVATTLAVLGPPLSPAQRRLAEAVPGLTLLETGLPLDWTARSTTELKHSAEAVMDLARRSGSDIVQVNCAALAAAKSLPLPVVAVQHSCTATWWATVRRTTLPADFRWRRNVVATGLRNADAVVAPTRAFAAAISSAYSVRRSPDVVHNGRSRAQRPAQANAAPFVFTAGRLWDDAKDVATLDRAAALLEIPVVAAGPLSVPGGTPIELRNIRLLGMLPDTDIADWLARRPVYVSMAQYEPFGLAVLEAAQAGCPLILADIPTFRELWDGAAVFVPPGDESALADAIGALAADKAQRKRLGQAAAVRSRRFTVAAMVSGMLDIYRSVLPATQALRIVA